MTAIDLKHKMKALKACVIVPTYNNEGTVTEVVLSVLKCCSDVIVVNDGSTDATASILRQFDGRITVVDYQHNRGKGYALKSGFRKALAMGFDYAVTIDSDGQHFASDIEKFVSALETNPGALVIGSRGLDHDNMPGKNKFANNFSNFWFRVQTCRRLSDTQTGFRLYPLHNLHGLSLLTSRYEAELELLVFAAWHAVKICEIPIQVYYPPVEERVSHFRPARDFARISVLNTVLCVVAVIYGLPLKFLKTLMK